MNVYRPKFKDRKTDGLVWTPRWYIDFRDHHGTRQRFAGDTDKDVTAEFGRMIEQLILCRKRGVQPQDKLWAWLMALPVDTQARLVKLDLADKAWFMALSQDDRLSVWVDEFENWLRTSKGKSGFHRNAVHVATTVARVRKIVDGGGFTVWRDITKSKVESYLGGLSVSLATHGGYIKAFKDFCTWIVRDGRAELSPVQYLDLVTVPDKERRRPLAGNEVEKLLRAAVNGPTRYGLTGVDRAIVYVLGIVTGFRRNELAHLTAASFDLEKATVRLDAAFCKDRCDAKQFLPMALASHLVGYLADKDTTEPLFHLPNTTALMIQADAADAGLPIIDADGRELVFHCLWHGLRTELESARVSAGVIDTIMRHKPSGIGAKFCRHVSEFEVHKAIERLPEYSWPGDLMHQDKAVS
jgi:integrase